MKALFKNSILKNSMLIVSGLLSANSQAFVPNASQLGRFQPGLLSRSRAFSSTGHIEYQGNKMSYALDWFAPETYQVTIQQISPSVYEAGQGPSSWTLIRRKTLCLLKAGNRVINCPSPQAWSLLELSGVPEAGARGLYSAEILEMSEIAFKETDSTQLTENGSNNRVQLVVSKAGKNPSVELELRGPNANTTNDGEEYPLVRFDQSFLAPTLLRSRVGGEIFTIMAQSDLDIKRDRTRFTHVLAHRLDVSSNFKRSLRIVRSEPKPNPSLSAPQMEKSLSQIDSFKSELSLPGLFLLDALLLTH